LTRQPSKRQVDIKKRDRDAWKPCGSHAAPLTELRGTVAGLESALPFWQRGTARSARTTRGDACRRRAQVDGHWPQHPSGDGAWRGRLRRHPHRA